MNDAGGEFDDRVWKGNMNQIDLISIRHLDDKLSHLQKRWAWQNGLPLEESLRRLLGDPSYCEKLGTFLMRVYERSRRIGR